MLSMRFQVSVCVKAGIFHGDEPLCEIMETSQVGSSLRWNETLIFSIPVSDIPRSARLCVSVCSVSRNRKKQVGPILLLVDLLTCVLVIFNLRAYKYQTNVFK